MIRAFNLRPLSAVEEIKMASQDDEYEYDYLFKIVLIGDYGVGKTELLSRFTRNSFVPVVKFTVGLEFDTRIVQVDGKRIKVQIWDTADYKRFKSMLSHDLRGAKGVMLLYDITKYSTFESIPKWFEDTRYFADPDTVVMLVGTNCHKGHLRAVFTDKAKEYADLNELHFFEVSALDTTNVEQAFMCLITEVYKKVVQKREQEQIQNTEVIEHKDFEQTVKFSEWAAGSKSTQDSSIISEFIEQMAIDVHQKYKSGVISVNDLPKFEHSNFSLQKFGSLDHMDEILFYIKSIHESLKKYFTHRFEGHTYFSPPNCEHCGEKLKGFFRQGVKCKDCGISCHKHCMDSVVALCTKYKNDKTSPETVAIVDKLSTEKDLLPPENEGSTQELFDDTAQESLYMTQQSPLEIKEHPKDTTSKPGERVEFSVKAEPVPSSYKWYFQRVIAISPTDEEFEGASTERLVIKKCLPKHKGTYECRVTDESGQMVHVVGSLWATLKIDGEVIETEESKLLGEILRKSNIDLSLYGIKMEQLNELTYEEVQYSLKEHPGTHFLSQNLRDQLKSKLNDERLYKEAIANDTSVSVAYVKILALGPGQVGKSTFLYRLMGLMEGNIQTADPETQPQASTGITEQREVCIQYTTRTGALTSKNQWQLFDESTELKSQLGGLVSLISEQSSEPNPSSISDNREHHESKNDKPVILPDKRSLSEHLILTSTFNDSSSSKQSEYKESATIPNPVPANVVTESNLLQCKTDIEAVISEFEVIHEEANLSQTQIQLDILLNIADIGGQPAFLEMLPSLTIGPALYLVFMNLLQGLDTKYPVVFKSRENRKQVLCQNYTYTSEEIIFTALSSIASFGNSDEEVEAYVLKNNHQLTETLVKEQDANQQTNSLALLVGTFADQVSNDEIEALQSKIKQLVQETKFYTEGLLYDTKLLLVNNFSGRTSEVEEQRSLIERLLREKFRKYQIPARWLMFSICLKLVAKKLNNFELSFNACVDIGHRFGMTEETVRAALKFLHKYIGLVMYFPNNPRLKDLVICDPQIVFSSVSELIFDIYNPNKNYLPEAVIDNFIKTGCFSPQDIKLQTFNSRNTLSLDTIIELLVYLNIAAKVPSSTDESSIQRRKYFLPAVLQTADTSLVQLERAGDNDELLPEPLCIQFVTGYLPLGFVCALSANLMANNNLLQLVPFKENDQFITYKNMMRFRYRGEIDIIMLSGPKYCEFRIKRSSKTSKIEFWDSNCCPLIKTIITEAAESVVQSMNHGDSVYKLSNCFEFAFKCPEHKNAEVGHEPLAEFIYEPSVTNSGTVNVNAEPTRIQCKSSLCKTSSPVTPKMKMWFGKEIPATPLNILKKPMFRENVFRLSAEGTRPLRYQWYKDDEELTDGCDYKGTNGPELFVRNLVPPVKGVYYCRVTDKQNHSILTQSVEFDPFEVELKVAGLENEEIRAIIVINGFRSVQQLKMTCFENIVDLKTEGEKVRVKRFLEQLHQQNDPNSGSTLELNLLRDVFWEVRAKWYLLGIQLEVNHSNLEVSKRKREAYDQYMFVLKSFLSRKDPPPSWVDVKQALESELIGCHSFDLSPEVQEKLKQLSDDRLTSESGKLSKAAQLKKVVTALWEVRAQWRRLAGEVEGITEGDCEAIAVNHSSVEECFAALLHRCLTIHKESARRVLIDALQSKVFGRHDIASEFSTLT